MPGGTFDPGVEKERAGLYINFKAAALNRITSGERGTVVIPLITDWGQHKTFIDIEEEGQVFSNFAHDINDGEMLLIREAFKNAKLVKGYRLNAGTPASATVSTMTVTSHYGGTRGNDIIVKSDVNVLDNAKKDVETYLDGRLVDTQTGANISELQPNAYVTFSGDGAIPATAGTPLTGGTDGVVINQDWTDFLSATETQYFDVLAYPTTDETLKASFVTFIKRMRDDEGKKIVGVAPGLAGDYEGIINVKNGVKLNDGTMLEAVDAVAWVAGASAGASITQSLTYKAYDSAADANPRYTNSQIIAALKAGEFLFIHDGKKVKVEKDINSLVTYSQDKNKRFSKNRVIRVLDAINNDLQSEFSESYIGKIDNNADGQALLKDAVNLYLETLEEAGAIKDFDSQNDFIIDPVLSVGDSVYATIGAQPVDSMEKFYFTVRVR
ncbi:phage tail sheath family protein [Desulforamulus aquiferis]|uniref:Phage tail sheath family protein n=1 Tax=Desulforamulus aquiferis TaxID=1397668 RepID=A0AAW7ZCJ8_9FIRM|nr:phage tail sheath family protein [Desulforamulus aquiferis]MDO7787126.1 phage tail sheath family protein [Desulforamulus aquiferis]